jgi:undecaprenyl-diphosphatase
MSILETIILGIVQGLTEFIPVSSSGHLVLVQNLFGSGSDHLFLEFINLGTLLALVIYFRKRITSIIRDVVVHRNYRLARNIIITTLPIGLVGFLAADFISTTSFFASSVVVIASLSAIGIVMILLEKLPKASSITGSEKLSASRSLSIGLAQILAFIPGISRSGIAIIAGRLNGLKPAAAAEYSFLVSIPIILGVVVKIFIKDIDYFSAQLPLLIIGNVFAFLAGLLAVGFLMRFLANHSLSIFGWYRLGLATVLTAILLIR